MNTNKKIANAKYAKTEKGKLTRAKAWEKYSNKPEIKKRRLEQKKKCYKKQIKYLNKSCSLIKNCTICNIEKDWVNFRIRLKNGNKYLNSHCLVCERTASNTYFKNNKKSAYKRRKDRMKSDHLYKLRICIGKRTGEIFRKKNFNKNKRFVDYIGCTIQVLAKHLEIQFKDGMTWENYGDWEIDHIIPLSSANTESDIYKLSHYTNLQPLWKFENRSKSDKITNKEKSNG